MTPRFLSRLQHLPVLMILVVSLSCSVHQIVQEPASLVRPPDHFSANGGAREVQGRWWRVFGDVGLDKAIDEALAGNLDLARARARLGMAAAVAAKSGAAAWPQLNLETSVNGSRNSMLIMGKAVVNETTVIPLTLGASYEIDLWGRVSNLRKAAALDVAARSEDRDAFAMSLSAQVVEAWFSLIELRAQRALLDQQIALAQRLLELVELRFSQGQSHSVAVLQQRQQVATLSAQRPLLDARAGSLRYQLGLLMGRSAATPPPLPSAAALPKLPPLPATGVPAKLLQRRPDVRAARTRVLAADHRVGVAVADRFPALRLTGRAGFQGRDGLSGLFDNWIWNLVAGLTAPLIDGGRRSAEVERNRFMLKDAVLAYSQVVLRALHEVEDALLRERHQRAYVVAIGGRLRLARATLAEARARFASGVGDYLTVLSALQSQQQAERDALGAQRQLLSYRVSLYRALAGRPSSSESVDRPGQGSGAEKKKQAQSVSFAREVGRRSVAGRRGRR